MPSSSQETALVNRFVNAFENSDIDQIVGLLTEDSRLAMPPEPFEYHGPQAIGEFLGTLTFWGEPIRLVATGANGQPAFGYYIWDPTASVFLANGILVLALSEGLISTVTRFGDTGLLSRFELPPILEL